MQNRSVTRHRQDSVRPFGPGRNLPVAGQTHPNTCSTSKKLVPETPGEIYERALDELLDAVKEKDDLGVRQAAEKAWLSVVRATDLYLRHKHHLRITSERPHAERRSNLRQVGREDLARVYSDLSQTLHGDIFYMGEDVSGALLRGFFLDAADYVEQTTGLEGQGLWSRTNQTLQNLKWPPAGRIRRE